MKKFLIICISISVVATTFAQHDHNNHNNKAAASLADTANQNNLSRLLAAYFSIKDALIAGNAGSASADAGQFIKIVNTVDYKVISEGNVNILLKDAAKIAGSKNIEQQRTAFADLSGNMIVIAKSIRLNEQPVYLQYCPMKKSSWLSRETEIKNPYYGQQMLTCGNVIDTLQPVTGMK